MVLPLGFVLLDSQQGYSIDYCMKYKKLVTREAICWIGMNAPVSEFMGLLAVENTNCDPFKTAPDGGKGLTQFMPVTAQWLHKKEKGLQELSISPSPSNDRWSIRAMILYNRWLYKYISCKDWWFVYRAYNGGLSIMNDELDKAKTCDRKIVEKYCDRKKIKLGRKVHDLCDINISYPYKIMRAAERYR